MHVLSTLFCLGLLLPISIFADTSGPDASATAKAKKKRSLSTKPQKTKKIKALVSPSKIEGLGYRIGLGLWEGTYLACMIDQAERKPFKMSLSTNHAWHPIEMTLSEEAPAKFEDVAVASDGTIGLLADNADLFVSYDAAKSWVNLGAPKDAHGKSIDVDRVAIANKEQIFVLDKESEQIFQYCDKHWQRLADVQAMTLAAGATDSLLVTTKNFDCFRLQQGCWQPVPNKEMIGRLALVHNKKMYGTVERDGRLYLYKFELGRWSEMRDANNHPILDVKQVVCNASGAVLFMTTSGELWRLGELNVAAEPVFTTGVALKK